MALMEWDNSLSVGVAQFDGEHMQLVAMLNSLHDAMKQGKGKERILPLLEELMKYTEKHFANEEKAMLQHKYPNYEIHKKEHAELVKAVKEFQQQLQEGKNVLTNQIFQFLKDWVIKHIGAMDKQYSIFFVEKKIS